MTVLSRKGHRVRMTAMLALSCCALAGLAFAEAAQATHGPTPVGASPTRVALVPWFEQCDPTTPAANSEHGGPFTMPSCTPPEREATAAPTTAAIMGPSSIGFVRYVMCPVGSVAMFCTPAGGVMPLPDVRVTGSVVDVQCGFPHPGCPPGQVDYDPAPGGPYGVPGTGTTPPTPACFPASGCALIATPDVEIAPEIPGAVAGPPPGSNSYRMTDHYNCDPPPANAPPGPPCPAAVGGPDYGATVPDVGSAPGAPVPDPPGIPVDCIPSGALGAPPGSSCGVNTTFNALVPGWVVPGKEATLQIGQVRLRDSGPNGIWADGFAPRDNMVFAVQGIFAP